MRAGRTGSDEFSLMEYVSGLIHADSCGRCLVGKPAALEMFVAHVWSLTRSEKKVAIFTALSLLYVVDEAHAATRAFEGGARSLQILSTVCRARVQTSVFEGLQRVGPYDCALPTLHPRRPNPGRLRR
jgi:hypothetical protein